VFSEHGSLLVDFFGSVWWLTQIRCQPHGIRAVRISQSSPRSQRRLAAEKAGSAETLLNDWASLDQKKGMAMPSAGAPA
jgi:hypothetical protein